jgi:hypothetical protein
MFSNGLACLRSVIAAGCEHTFIITGGRHPNDPPEFRWIYTVQSNLKTSISGTVHAFICRFAGLRLRNVQHAIIGSLQRPIQPSIQLGEDDQALAERHLLLWASPREVSEACGACCVIKRREEILRTM